MDFCGFRIFPTHRRLRRSSVRRFVRRFRHLRAAYWRGDLALDDMTASVQSWTAHAAHGDTWRLRAQIFAALVFQRGAKAGQALPDAARRIVAQQC